MEKTVHPENNQPPIEVPADQLSEAALSSLIESFILREGTDYGREEVSLEKKVTQVRWQIERGETKIVFDPNTESITLMTEHQWKKFQR